MNIKNNARSLRENLTDAERRLWRALKHRQIDEAKFRRQAPIGKFIVDFVCFERGIVIEIDGGQHADQTVHDDQRTRWLESQGFCVLRFWNNDVLVNTDGVVETIRNATENRRPPP